MNDIIHITNDIATEAKYSTVEMGYFDDPFIKHFINKKISERKSPEMNRGYYVRLKVITNMCCQFVKTHGHESQIINLGCGYDTLYWRLNQVFQIRYKMHVDLDLPEVIYSKTRKIQNNIHLSQVLGSIKKLKNGIVGEKYVAISCNVKNIEQFDNAMKVSKIDFSLPTLFISECVFFYISPKYGDTLLSHISACFDNVAFLHYEPINLHDNFGKVMYNNLQNDGYHMSGFQYCTNRESQISRYINNNFQKVNILTLNEIYNEIKKPELDRINALEVLDEMEGLNQLFYHYSVAFAYKTSNLKYTFKKSANLNDIINYQ